MTRRISQLIHRARAGETVVITEHDQPIAMLVPLPRTRDAAIDDLVRTGKLTLPSNPGGLDALLGIKPAPATIDRDSADVVSELRKDHA